MLQNEQNYKNHLAFKNNYDNLVSWMRQLREKIPPVTRSLSDRLNLESSATVLEVCSYFFISKIAFNFNTLFFTVL